MLPVMIAAGNLRCLGGLEPHRPPLHSALNMSFTQPHRTVTRQNSCFRRTLRAIAARIGW
jgi:hypothetical protein